MVDMQAIVRRQDQMLCASITCMIRHYVARRAKVIFDHPHNAADRQVTRRQDHHRGRGWRRAAVQDLHLGGLVSPLLAASLGRRLQASQAHCPVADRSG
jgi:hypothetical protein